MTVDSLNAGVDSLKAITGPPARYRKRIATGWPARGERGLEGAGSRRGKGGEERRRRVRGVPASWGLGRWGRLGTQNSLGWGWL